MKYSFFTILSLAICLFVSCNDDEVSASSTPECIQDIIEDLTQNDNSTACLASVKSYTFEGGTVYEVQEDECLDGSNFILNESCDTLCVINLFGQFTECGGSANFYEEAELIETVWMEEN